MNLYLAPVNSKGEIIYNHETDSQNTNFTSLTDSILIRKMRITTSIFSPPVVVVGCKKDEVKLNKSIYFNSTFGIVIEEIEIRKTDYGEEKESHLTCLISNQKDVFTPFAVTAVDECEDDELRITLMEKNALSLALTHSFACIGQKTFNAKEDTEDGCLSVAEIVESLSILPENQNADDENEQTTQKNIFNFESTRLHGDIDREQAFYIQQANYAFDCLAFLSRFIAPASQSRLQIISSLMFKYGYGFVYRPLDEQYFAIDLLSMLVPGYEYGGISNTFVVTNGCCDDVDRIIFKGSQSQGYFRNYAIDHMQAIPEYSNGLKAFEKLLNTSGRANHNHHCFSHNFADFYKYRLIKNQDNFYLKKNNCSTLGSGDYCYLSRYDLSTSPSSLNYDLDDKFGFGLSYLSKIFPSDTVLENFENAFSFFGSVYRVGFQNSYHTEQEGAQNCFFEDEVLIGDVNEDEFIRTVNQRLAYARYKLDYMQKNYIEQAFKFNNNKGISRTFNIVYELFNWLGFHTDIFNTIANFYDFSVQKNNPVKSSGATHSIADSFTVLDNDNYNYNLNSFADASDGDYDYLYNFKDKGSSSLFGKLCITIDCIDNNKNENTYNLTSSLTFYNDITDYNIDPFGWKVKDEQKQVAEQEVEQEEEHDNEEYENEQEQRQEIKQLKRPKWWLRQRSEDIIEEDEGLNNEPSYQAQSQHSDPRHESRLPALRNHQASKLPGGGSAVDLFNNSLFSLRNYDPESPASVIHRSLMLNNSGLENIDENNSPDIDDLLEGGRRLSKDPQ